MSTVEQLAEIIWDAAYGEVMAPPTWASATDESKAKYRRMAEAAAAHLVVTFVPDHGADFGPVEPDLG